MPASPRSRNKSGFDYGSYFRQMRTEHDLTTLPEDKTWLSAPPTEPEPHSPVLYLGCNVLRTSHMIRTATDILDLLGVDYVAAGGPAYCCGIVHHRNGDTDIAETLGRNTVRYLERFEPERVVMWCPSCISYYDEIFQVPASFEIQHMTEYLVEQLDRLDFVNEVPNKVALHHHSNSPARLREAAAAVKLLSAVPGLEYVDIESDSRMGRSCSSFTQEAAGPEVWRSIIESEMQQAVSHEADIYATLYHGCQRLICEYEESQPLAVEHYLSVFARALGIEHEDTYKKYRLWKDPMRVLGEMAPCMEANRISEVEARQVVSETFPAG